jgi:hypothetical protein
MNYITRAEWGAVPPRWSTPLHRSEGMFIHYNGGNPLPGNIEAGDFDAVCAHLRSTQQFHMGPSRGWPDIAYSWCVDATGRIYELRGWGVVGAHTMGWNERSHAIYLPLGGNQAPTEEQIAACRTVIAEHNRRYGRGFVKGHQQAPNQTACPGPAVLARINAGDFDPDTHPTETVPTPAGVDPAMNKPVMMRRKTDGTISVFYQGTPFRIDLRPKDVEMFQFFGAEFKGDSDPWFWEVTQAVKVG